jgi:hypothetical protein
VALLYFAGFSPVVLNNVMHVFAALVDATGEWGFVDLTTDVS